MGRSAQRGEAARRREYLSRDGAGPPAQRAGADAQARAAVALAGTRCTTAVRCPQTRPLKTRSPLRSALSPRQSLSPSHTLLHKRSAITSEASARPPRRTEAEPRLVKKRGGGKKEGRKFRRLGLFLPSSSSLWFRLCAAHIKGPTTAAGSRCGRVALPCCCPRGGRR